MFSKEIKPESNKASRLAVSNNPLFGSSRWLLFESRQGLIWEALSTFKTVHPVTAHELFHLK